MSYPVDVGVVRSRSEVVILDTNTLNGRFIANKAGVHIPFPTAGGRFREVVEVRALSSDYVNIGPTNSLPTPAVSAQDVFITIAKPDGSFVMEDMPIQRLMCQAMPAVTKFGWSVRNLIWRPVVVDMLQSFIYTTPTTFSGEVWIELIYR